MKRSLLHIRISDLLDVLKTYQNRSDEVIKRYERWQANSPEMITPRGTTRYEWHKRRWEMLYDLEELLKKVYDNYE